MFSVEPAKHECGPQDDLFDARCSDECLLGFFGLGVAIYRQRVHDGRRDAYDVRHFVPQGGFQQAFGRMDVIPYELFGHDSADLCVCDDERVAAGKLRLPFTGRAFVCGKIVAQQTHGRVVVFEDGCVGRMFIDCDDVGKSPRDETRNQVLANKCCGPSDYNFFVISHEFNSIWSACFECCRLQECS